MPSFTPACQNHCPTLQHSFPSELFPPSLPQVLLMAARGCITACSLLDNSENQDFLVCQKWFCHSCLCERGGTGGEAAIVCYSSGSCLCTLTSCQAIIRETCREQHMSKLVIFLPAFTPRNRLNWINARPVPSLDSQRSMHSAGAAASSAGKCTDQKITCERAVLA